MLEKKHEHTHCPECALAIAEDMETYRVWKEELARTGKTPEEVISFYREIGMTQYADKLCAVIRQMEGSLEVLA